jgi:hypothetical protein
MFGGRFGQSSLSPSCSLDALADQGDGRPGRIGLQEGIALVVSARLWPSNAPS